MGISDIRRLPKFVGPFSRAAYVVVLFCGGMILQIGCHSDPYERVVVSGKVSYEGEPIQEGMIRFLPIEGTQTPPNGGYIMDGTYRIKTRGGVAVGTHRVIIEAFRNASGTPKGPADPLTDHHGPAPRQFLPKKYNEESQLTITIDPGSGEIVKDFELIR